MTVIFHRNVWIEVEGGWATRPATSEDWEKRRLISELLASETTNERRAEIRERLEA